MRSGAGAACPFTRRDLFLDELFPDLLDFLAVAPVVLEWTTLRLLVALLWLMFDAVFCAATAGKLPPPAETPFTARRWKLGRRPLTPPLPQAFTSPLAYRSRPGNLPPARSPR